MTPIFTAVLPIALTNHNDGQGHEWAPTHRERKSIAQILWPEFRRKPFEFRVDVAVTRILHVDKKLWDADSIGRGNAKQLLDALVSLGWFHDDGPKWIRNCDFRQDVSQRAKLRQGMTRVEVFEIQND